MLPHYPAAVLAGIRRAEAQGRLPVPSAEEIGDIYPFEPPTAVRAIADPSLPEPSRHGERPEECRSCATPDSDHLWVDEHWRVRAPAAPFGIHLLFVEPRAHADLADLPEPAVRAMGAVLQATERALTTALDGVGRVHVNRWGDGAAHLHWWLLARPAGLLQLRGSLLPLWLDVLPPLPEPLWRADLERVRAALH